MLTLTVTQSTPGTEPSGAYLVRLNIASSENSVPAKLLILQRASGTDELVGVATPAQVHDMPEDSAGASSPFFRVSAADVWVRSPSEAEELSDRIQLDLRDFYTEWKLALENSSTKIVTIP